MKDWNTVVIATLNDVYFAQKGASGIILKKSTGWSTDSEDNREGVIKQACLAVGRLSYDAIVGTVNGQIIRFKGLNIYEVKNAHSGSCNSISSRLDESGFLSGGSDAKIIIWDANFVQTKVIDITTFQGDLPLLNPRIRALCESDDQKWIIVGTRSGSIYRIENRQTIKQVHAAHSDNELWGLINVPNKDEVITCAGDSLVIRWDTSKKKAKKYYKLDYTASCCDISPDGLSVAIGCSNGFLIVIDYETFSVVKCKKKDRFKEINVVKFSPDNQHLAVGASDNVIMIYKTSSWQKAGTMNGHRSPVIKIDWSTDSKFIHSNGYQLENNFYDFEARSEVKVGDEMIKNIKWATWTCLYGWQTIGIWNPSSSGMDVNATCRSPDSKLLVTGDDFGKLKIFKYPSYVKNSSHFNIVAHASYISNVCFNSKGDKLFSTGQIDNTLMQWRVIMRKVEGAKDIDFDGFDNVDLDVTKKNALESQVLAQALQLSEINPKMGIFDLAIEQGDQMLATKPFRKQAENSIPLGFEQTNKAKEPPEGNLFLRHIFGFRSFDCKHNLFFLADSKMCVFTSASVAITMNTETKGQRFFTSHTDDVVAMDITKDRRYCVTGSVCSKDNATETDYFIWDTTSMEEVGRVTDFHGGSVKLVRFSPDRTLIASVGRDEPHVLAIHDWKENRLISSCIVDKNSVFDLAWMDKNYLVTVGITHIKFWSIRLKNLTSYNGSWGKFKPTPLICATYTKNRICLTGSSKGEISIWANCTKVGGQKQAHVGTVFCLYYDENADQLYSGGKDGLVKVWRVSEKSLVQVKTVYDGSVLQEPDVDFVSIRSFDIHIDGSMLIGTRNSKIIRIDAKSGQQQLVMDSHFDGTLSALAVHPKSPKFVTAAGDKTLRLWDPLKKKMDKKIWVKHEIIALDWSNHGEYIVAGSKADELVLYDANLVQIFSGVSHFGKKKNLRISRVKFSPDDSKIAVGAYGNPGDVEILEVSKEKKLKRLFVIQVDFESGIIKFDWSIDSHYLMVNTESYELKFVNINSQELIKPSSSKIIDWTTWTCIYGYATLGVFPNILGEDVGAVCRSGNRQVIATGDDLQQVNLFRFPAMQTKCGCKKYSAHSASVVDVRFILNDHGLVSIGGKDKSIVVWNTDFGGDNKFKDEWLHGTGISYDPTLEIAGIQKKRNYDKHGNLLTNTILKNSCVETEAGFSIQEVADGDESFIINPWYDKVKPPTNFFKPLDNNMPKPSIKIEPEDQRNNLFYLNNGEILYTAAAIGIIHNPVSNTQKLLRCGTEHLISSLVCPEGKLAFLGEQAERPNIYIWDTSTDPPILVTTIRQCLKMGVEVLTLSPSGRYLLAACTDDQRTFVIYDRDNNYQLVYCDWLGDDNLCQIDLNTGLPLNKVKIYGSLINSFWITEDIFVVMGAGVAQIYTDNGDDYNKATLPLSNATTNIILSAAVCPNGDVVCGTSSGEFLVWRESAGEAGSAQLSNPALHSGPLDAISIFVDRNSYFIITGSKDCKLIVQDEDYNVKIKLDIYSKISNCLDGQIRAIATLPGKKSIAVGLICGEIYEISFRELTEAGLKAASVKVINKAHYNLTKEVPSEVTALVGHPDIDGVFFTCADDGTLRQWDFNLRKCSRFLNLNIDQQGNMLSHDPNTLEIRNVSKLQSLDVNIKSDIIAVGCEDGTIRIVSLKTWSQITMFRHRRSRIRVVEFSPDGLTLAVGCDEGYIDLYSLPLFKTLFKIKKSSSPITHLDWSKDSKFIQYSNLEEELVYIDVKKGTILLNGFAMLRDETWKEWRCPQGWPNLGLYNPSNLNMTSISCLHRSGQMRDSSMLVAAGYKDSRIKVYRYPVLNFNAQSIELKGHAGPISDVYFSPHGNYLFSIGSDDLSIIQWRFSAI